jgi:RES domain-containing protein
MSHDYEILDVLDQLDSTEYTGTLWRTTWIKREPFLGGTSGGRWSPSKKIEALYTSLEKNISIAELHYHLSQAPIFSSCGVLIWNLNAEILNLLDLTSSKVLADLKLSEKSGKALISHSQKIGAATCFLGFQGVIVPSYRRSGNNCVIFSENIEVSQIEAKSKEEINWPAWINKHK